MKIKGHAVSTTMLLPDWNETNERRSSFIKNKPDANVTRGYYFKAIDFEAKKLYLSHEQVNPVAITSAKHATYYDADFQVPYAYGGKLGVVNNFEYSYGTSHFLNNKTWYPKATIAGIDGNVITYDGDIGFPSVYNLSSLDPEDYSVYCIDEPLVGEHVLMNGGCAFGPYNKTLGFYGFAAGLDNKILGSYGAALGRLCEAGFASFATNFGNKAIAQRSFASGSETQALAFASHTEGEGTVAENVNGQHVEGRYNVPDEKGEYLHIVGGGDKVYRNNKWEIIRRNIHTVGKSGRAWYADGVFVGGTSMHDASPLATEAYTDKKSVDANLGESRSNKLFAFPANRIKLHALIDDVWTEVNDPNIHKLFTNGMQEYTGSDEKTTWKPFDNSANYLGADKAVPTAWRITLTNPVRSQGGDRYVHLNAACVRVQGTPENNSVELRVAGRQMSGTEVTYIQSFALSGSPSNNTSCFDNGAAAAFGGWTPSSASTNLDTLYIYLTRDTSKALNKNFAIDQIHFFGRQTYSSLLNMVNYDHAYTVGDNGKDVVFQGKIQAQPATEDNQTVTLGQVKTAVNDAASEAVAKVVGSSKATLDTLEELGKALGEDPNFATTMATELGKKADAADVEERYMKKTPSSGFWWDAGLEGVVLSEGIYAVLVAGIDAAVVYVSDIDENNLSGYQQYIGTGKGVRYASGSFEWYPVEYYVSVDSDRRVSISSREIIIGDSPDIVSENISEFKYKLLLPFA